MYMWEEDQLLLDAVDPEPGWSGLYDPWNGRRRGQNPFELYSQDELYYSTELSDYEDDDHGSGQIEEDGGDNHEVHMSSPCRDRSPSPPMRGLSPIWGPSPSRNKSPLRTQAASKRPRSSSGSSPNKPPATRRRVYFNPEVAVFGQPSFVGYLMMPQQFRGIRRREEGDEDNQTPPSRRLCRNNDFYEAPHGQVSLNA